MAKAHAETTVTIAVAASLSDAKNISNRQTDASLVGIITPASMEGTSLTFQASNDGTTFLNVYAADGTEFTVVAAADRWIAIAPPDFASAGWIKVRTGTAAAPTVQAGGDAILTLIYRTVA